MQRLTLRDSITQARVAERRLAVHDSSPAWLGSRVWEWRTELRLTVTSESSRASSAVGSADFGSQTADLAHTGPRHEGTLTWLASQQLFGAAKLLASKTDRQQSGRRELFSIEEAVSSPGSDALSGERVHAA